MSASNWSPTLRNAKRTFAKEPQPPFVGRELHPLKVRVKREIAVELKPELPFEIVRGAGLKQTSFMLPSTRSSHSDLWP